jgi:hypothetical protein
MYVRWNAAVQSAACANYEYQYPRNINMIGSSTYCVLLYQNGNGNGDGNGNGNDARNSDGNGDGNGERFSNPEFEFR